LGILIKPELKEMEVKMSRIFSGIFIILHGLVHIWYVVLSFNLVIFQSDMGWTGNSWLFASLRSNQVLRMIAGVLFILSTILFVISGIMILANFSGADTILFIAAMISTITLVVFWDGQTNMMLQKGVIGVIINLVILVAVFMIS
jgi:hypothetical protein